MHPGVTKLVTLIVLGGVLTGCGAGGPGSGEGTLEGLQTVEVGPLQVDVTAAAGFTVTPLTSSGPAGIVVLHGATIRRLQEVGYNTIAFARKVFPESSLWDLWLMNADGSNQRRLTNAAGYELSPAWSPNGQQIAFARYLEGTDAEISVLNFGAPGMVARTSDTRDDDLPAWSPDGLQIAYTKYDTDSEIYVSNADGSGATNLTSNGVADTSPSWSPDGRQIVYSHHDGSDTEIRLMDAHGGNQTTLTSNSTSDGWPAWSPDGTKIAWSQGVPTLEDIYVMNADGSGARRIISQPDAQLRPKWSPDGRWLTYDYVASFSSQVWRANADGSEKTNLSLSGEDDKGADWRPLASVVRSLIGAARSDGGSDPPFGTQRPIAMVSLGPQGLLCSASVSIPAAAQASVRVAALADFSTELAALRVTASQLGSVLEDRGRGLAPRVWNVGGTPQAGALLILFAVQTGRITTIVAIADQALTSAAVAQGTLEGKVSVRGPIIAALDLRDPGRNLAPVSASEVLIDGTSGQVVTAH